MTRIVYIITKLELGGAQKVALTLMQGVADAPYETLLLAGAGGILDEAVHKDKRVTLLPELKREISITGLFSELRTWYQLIKYLRTLRKQDPHIIVHTHSTKAGLLGRWAAWCARIKIRIHTIHGYAFHNHQPRLVWWPIFLCEWLTSLITTHFVCVSSFDYQTGCRLFPFFAQKTSMIRAAIAWDRFQAAAALRTPKNTTAQTFGTIACFKPQKNIFDSLRAFHYAVTQNPELTLEIIGDGTQRPAIEQWIHEHGLRDKVKLLGWCHDVHTKMAHWDAFILTSLWEGLPCAIIEARLLKLPVLAYDTGGIRDVITSEVNGYLYPQGSWKLMGHDMLRLASDPAWFQQLAYHTDELQEFHDATMIAKHRALYHQLIQVQKNS